MSLLPYLLLVFWLLSSSFHSVAHATSISQQRTVFQQAQKALKTNQTTQFKKLNSQLEGYILQPYLDYLYLRHTLKYTDNKTISQFIKQNQGMFYADRLNNAWLNHLAKSQKWPLFLQHYTEPSSAQKQCNRLQALLSTGNTQQVLLDAPALWLVPKSQHKACDSAFNYWQKQDQLTDSLRHKRLILALEKQQFDLARYLAKPFKNAGYLTQIITLWEQAHRSPTSLLNTLPVKKSSTLAEENEFTHNIIQHAIQRLARKSTEKAFSQWQRIHPYYHFSQQSHHEIQAYIGLRAALNRDDKALEYFGDAPEQPWRVRAALWQQNWQAAHTAILSLSAEQQQEPVWQYWLARSKDQLGDSATAETIYHSIRHDRDFYSFLAADQLGQAYNMNHQPITLSRDELTMLSLRPDVRMLKEFYDLDMGIEARQQAYAFRQNSSARELQLLATLTHQWGWHHQTISLLGKAQYWDALNLRFPVLFKKYFTASAKKTGLNPSWLLGVARQESAFDPQAHSRVGAKGLMQLMPQTAKHIAQQIKKPIKNMSEQLTPGRNIELGSAYLRKMFDDKNNNPVLATASYNAGSHRVSKWMPKQALPADIWIENIPFKETRHYAKSVLTYATIFDYQRQQKIKPLSSRMPIIQPQHATEGEW